MQCMGTSTLFRGGEAQTDARNTCEHIANRTVPGKIGAVYRLIITRIAHKVGRWFCCLPKLENADRDGGDPG